MCGRDFCVTAVAVTAVQHRRKRVHPVLRVNFSPQRNGWTRGGLNCPLKPLTACCKCWCHRYIRGVARATCLISVLLSVALSYRVHVTACMCDDIYVVFPVGDHGFCSEECVYRTVPELCVSSGDVSVSDSTKVAGVFAGVRSGWCV